MSIGIFQKHIPQSAYSHEAFLVIQFVLTDVGFLEIFREFPEISEQTNSCLQLKNGFNSLQACSKVSQIYLHLFKFHGSSQQTYIYLFKFSDRNTRRNCEICSKLTIKTPEHILT